MKIAIIGSGLSGLTCLHNLRKTDKNIDVTLLESLDRSGGRMFSYYLEGHNTPIELGAGYFHKYYLNLLELISEFGLEGSVVPKGSGVMGLVLNEKSIELTNFGIMKSLIGMQLSPYDILSLIKLRNFGKRTGGNIYKKVSDILSNSQGSDIHKELLKDDWYKKAYHESTSSFLNELTPNIREFLESLAEKQMFQKFSELKMSVGALLLSSTAAKLHTLSTGMDSLPKAMADKYRDFIKFNHKVTHCEYKDSNKWSIETQNGFQDNFDFVVFALPMPFINKMTKFNLPLQYNEGRILIIKGDLKKQFAESNNLYIIDHSYGVSGISHYGPNIFKVGVKANYDLAHFFSKYEILLDHHWEYATPRLNVQIPEIISQIAPNAYIASDYFLPSMVASVNTGIDVAKQIIKIIGRS